MNKAEAVEARGKPLMRGKGGKILERKKDKGMKRYTTGKEVYELMICTSTMIHPSKKKRGGGASKYIWKFPC